jgi:hypothetical protein
MFFNDYGSLHDRWILIGALLAILVLLFSCLGLMELMSYAQCKEFANMNPRFDFNWTILNGCMVKTQDSNAWISATKILELINQ